MKRKIAALATLMVLLTSCIWLQQQGIKTETIVISYETLATIAFPTVLVYLQEREKNGSLSGDALVNAKKQYAQARQMAIQAGDIMKEGISGKTNNLTLVPALLRQAAIILANLSGGKVSENNLTIPKGGK